MAKTFAAQVVRICRGKQSVQQIAKRLRVARGTWAKWEAGESRMPWSTFIQVPRVQRRLKRALRKITYPGDAADEGAFLKHLLGFRKLSDWSGRLDLSTSALKNTIQGRRQLFLNLVLDSLETNLSLSPFLRELFPEDFDASLAPPLEKEIVNLAHLDQKPWSEALYAFLPIPGVHGGNLEGLLRYADILGVPESEIRNTYAQLVQMPETKDALRQATNRERALSDRAYWSHRLEQLSQALRSADNLPEKLPWSLYLCAVNPTQRRAMEEAFATFHQEITSILTQPQKTNPSELVFLSTQCLPLEVFRRAPPASLAPSP